MEHADFDQNAEGTAQRVVTGLSKLGLAMKNNAWHVSAGRGLSATQAQVLALLYASREPMRLRAIASQLAVTEGTASASVAALEAKGLLTKRPAEDDPRARAIALTPAGREEAEYAMAWPDFLLPAVGELTEQERAVFLKSLVKMVRRLQEDGRIPVQRMCVTCRFFSPNRYPDTDTPHHCGFVDAHFGDRSLRLDCADHSPADPTLAAENWQKFALTT